jgi:hypothetical protein
LTAKKSIRQTGGGNEDNIGKGNDKGKGNVTYMMSPVVRLVSVQ